MGDTRSVVATVVTTPSGAVSSCPSCVLPTLPISPPVADSLSELTTRCFQPTNARLWSWLKFWVGARHHQLVASRDLRPVASTRSTPVNSHGSGEGSLSFRQRNLAVQIMGSVQHFAPSITGISRRRTDDAGLQ